MTESTVKHGLRKNLPNGVLYNSQVGILIFSLGMSFKLSAAPGIISQDVGSSTAWIFLFYTVFDVVCLCLILAFARMGGDAFLMSQNSVAYKIACSLTSLLLTFKATVYFCYITAYMTHELFTGVEPYLLYILFATPIIYLGIKGIRTIARTGELFFLVFFIIVIFNLVFLDTDLDFGRNLPVFSVAPSEFFAKIPKYGLWFNDFLPLLFLRIKDKRMPYISTTIAITWTLVNLIVFLGVAIYGDALKMVADLLIHIASFNQLSLEIGRMEWTNLFAMLIMSLLSLSVLFSGAITSCKRAIGFDSPIKIIFPLSLLCTSIFVPSSILVTEFALGVCGYVLFALALLLPIVIFTTFVIAKQRAKGWYNCFECEYVTQTPHPNPHIDSLADGILATFKETAKEEETTMPNGTLQPKGEDQ